MAKPLDPKEVVTIQEIAISNMLEIEALIDLRTARQDQVHQASVGAAARTAALGRYRHDDGIRGRCPTCATGLTTDRSNDGSIAAIR